MPLETSRLWNPKEPDPQYDAWKAGFPIREAEIRSDQDFRKRKAQSQYDQGLEDLARSVTASRSNTLSSLEGRGVLRSGETQRRLGEITSRENEARARAGAAKLEAQQAADADAQRRLAAINAELEQQVAAAKEREWQKALQIWYAAKAGQAAPAPVKRTPYRPPPSLSGSTNQPTLAQVAAAMRPAAKPAAPAGFNTSGYPV
jgi:hypothetical protein